MAEPEEWSPSKGWRIAGLALVWRLPVAFVMSMLAAAGLYWLIGALERGIGQRVGVSIVFILVIGFLGGCPQGWLCARGLVNRSGLAGGTLAVVIGVLLALLQLASYTVACVALPDWPQVLFYLYGVVAIAAIATAVKILLTDG